MTRLHCARCGFDGYCNPTAGHICMRMITLDEYDRLQSLEQELERVVKAGKEALVMAEEGLWRIPGGNPDTTVWSCCTNCYRADWEGHAKDCRGKARIDELRLAISDTARRTSGDERG